MQVLLVRLNTDFRRLPGSLQFMPLSGGVAPFDEIIDAHKPQNRSEKPPPTLSD